MVMLHLPRLIFAVGARRALPAELALLGVKKPLMMTDRGVSACGVFARVTAELEQGSYVVVDDVPENPTFEGVDRAAAVYRANGCDGVVAVGGGSVIDTAKLVAVLGGHPGNAADYVGHSEKVTKAVVPLIVLPTTAGTGSESSPDAGIHPDSRSVSSGISSFNVVPKVAICDPELTMTLPARLTAATGLDALSHCVEGYLSTKDAPPIDALALDGIRRICAYLPRATAVGSDLEARSEVMMAAFEGGAAISKGLGPAHAIAISCGDQGLHHGILSILGLVASVPVMQRHVPERTAAIAAAMGLPVGSDLSQVLRNIIISLGLPSSLTALGYVPVDLDELARQASISHFNMTSPYKPDQHTYKEMIRTILN
jgi:4-hydroxybutyrate dehydrogenase